MPGWEGEVVEWSITAVLKTVELKGSGGSNPSLSARKWLVDICKPLFYFSVTKNVTNLLLGLHLNAVNFTGLQI